MPRCNQKLRELRLAARRSQNQLAREAEIDRNTLSKAEKGEDVQELTVAKIADALSRLLRRQITIDALTKA